MEQKLKTLDFAGQLALFFGGILVGSQILVRDGYLHYDDTRDVDMQFPEIAGVSAYLDNEGWTVEASNVDWKTYTNAEYDKPLDIRTISGRVEKQSSAIILDKINRGNADDWKQIAMIAFNKGGNSMKSYKELQEFYLNNQPEGPYHGE